MMVLSVTSKTPHCKGNESQDTVTLLETVLMSTERETRLREAEGFMKMMQEHPHLDQASQRVEAKEQLDSASTYNFELL
jgi:hypothetical protein